MEKALLILDLDETLVYARRELAGNGYDFRATDYYVSRRPHLAEILESVLEGFTVAVGPQPGRSTGAK